MSLSAKSNLGHRRRLSHKRKRQIATSMVSRDKEKPELYNGIFYSLKWRQRKWAIMQRVRRQKIRAKYYAELRRGERGNKAA